MDGNVINGIIRSCKRRGPLKWIFYLRIGGVVHLDKDSVDRPVFLSL